MKKILILMTLIFVSLGLAGCRSENEESVVQRIGVGYIQNDQGVYFVEIDSQRYAVNFVAMEGPDGLRVKPVNGMEVTGFCYEGSYLFLAGDCSYECFANSRSGDDFREIITGIGVVFFMLLAVYCIRRI